MPAAANRRTTSTDSFRTADADATSGRATMRIAALRPMMGSRTIVRETETMFICSAHIRECRTIVSMRDFAHASKSSNTQNLRELLPLFRTLSDEDGHNICVAQSGTLCA